MRDIDQYLLDDDDDQDQCVMTGSRVASVPMCSGELTTDPWLWPSVIRTETGELSVECGHKTWTDV